MSIWDDNNSRYGTYPVDTKPVSKSTMYRWKKTNRTTKRKSIAIKRG